MPNHKHNSKPLLLVEGDVRLSGQAQFVAYWDLWDVPKPSVSIPAFLDLHGESLKEIYTQWCWAFNTSEIRDKPLYKYFSSPLLYGYSFSWQTNLIERLGASPMIYCVMKLLALEKFYDMEKFSSLEYIGDDKNLSEILYQWCNDLGINYKHRPNKKDTFSIKKFLKKQVSYLYLANSILYFIKYALLRWLLIKLYCDKSSQEKMKFTSCFVSYFPSIDLAALKTGKFKSNYWGDLPERAVEWKCKTRWIWMFLSSPQLTFRESIKARNKLNKKNALQHFELLEESLSFKMMVLTLREFFRLRSVFLKLNIPSSLFQIKGKGLNFYKMVESEFKNSYQGVRLMRNILLAGCFKNAFLGQEKELYYLWENHSWEQAMLAAWKENQKGQARAVVHSNQCTSEMYLMTFSGLKLRQTDMDLPHVDAYITIGEHARQMMCKLGWPSEKIYVAEALRYQHLLNFNSFNLESNNTNTIKKTLLIATGYSIHEVEKVVLLLEAIESEPVLDEYAKILFKSHPFCPVDKLLKGKKIRNKIKICHTPLFELFKKVDVILLSNSTSVASEVAWLGLPLLITSPEGSLDTSPLRKKVNYIDHKLDLIKMLKSPVKVEIEKDTYCLDSNLPRWRNILSSPTLQNTDAPAFKNS